MIVLICHSELTMRRVLRRMIGALCPAAEVLEADDRDAALRVVAGTEIAGIVVDSRLLAGADNPLLAAGGTKCPELPIIILAWENWAGEVPQSRCPLIAISSLYELQRSLMTLSNGVRVARHTAVVAGATVPPIAPH